MPVRVMQSCSFPYGRGNAGSLCRTDGFYRSLVLSFSHADSSKKEGNHMKRHSQKFRRITSLLMASLMASSVFAVLPAVPASAVSYSDMSALDQYAYSGNDLGAVYSKSSTTFKVWAPTATNVQLKRYKTGSDSESGAGVIETKAMTKQSQGIWSVTVNGDIAGTYYTYLVTNNGSTKETVDIYAKSTGVNGNRGMVIDLDSTDPAGWDNDTRIPCANQTDSVIWEAHVRDFSSSSDSGMTNKGKYLAFTETGTTVNNDGVHPTGIDYLEDLGVTHVHLLPVYDYASVDETKLSTDQFNWGYDPKNYNTPEGSYSTNPYDGNVRVKEFKQMVQALHKKGIGVVMDVVYNHTYSGGSGIDDWFDYTVPGYYYRQKSDGTYSNGSGCGNETASDREMYQKFMIDSLRYWATEYHLDGFRFDLMGIHDCDTMNKIRQELDKISPDILLYGEPWTAEATPCPKPTAVQGNMYLVSEEVAAFNDKVRDAIKGSCFNASDPGFIQGATGFETALKGGIQANSTTMGNAKWSKQPSQTVTYTSAHDNYTLYDKLVKSVKGGSGYGNRYDDLVAMNKLAGGIILTSQGMSFFQAGEEFARSKYGDENSYKSSTSVNQLKWSNTVTYSDIVSYYKGLISIRKAYAPFRDPTNVSNGTIYFSWGDSCPAKVVAFTMYNKNSTGKEWNFAAVIHNANTTSQTVKLMTYDGVTLPTQWVKVADGNTAGTESLGTVSGNSITVPARSTVVLIDKTSFDNTDLTSKCSVTVNHILESDGSILKTETLKGDEGASYTTSADSSLLNNGYILDHTSGATTGTFSKTGATVSYYYKIDTSKYGSVIIRYRDADEGTKIADDETITGLIGTATNITPKSISGFEYSSMESSAPADVFSGITPVVTMYYTSTAGTGTTIHYYNSNGWSQVSMYVYNGSGSSATIHTGAWPGTLMTSEGNGWYVGNVPDVDSALFIANNNVTTYGEQDPAGYNTTGYPVAGESWVKNGQVYPTGIVNVYLENTDGSRTLLQTLKGMADGVNTYTVTPDLPDGVDITVPDNTSGLYTKGVTEVVYKAVQSEPLVNNSTISKTSLKVGESATLTAAASGGYDPYTYTYRYKKLGESDYTIIGQADTSSKTAKFTPSEAGTYYVDIIVTDSTSRSVTKTFTVSVSAPVDPLANNSTVSASTVTAGTEIKITGKASGGTAPYKYAYYYKRSVNTKWNVLGTEYGTATSASFTPGSAAIFDVKVSVKDNTGEFVDKVMQVTVIDNNSLINESYISTEIAQIGDDIRATGAASGGTGPYTYAYYFKRSTNTKWNRMGEEFGSSLWATLVPKAAADYDLKVIAKDSKGNTVTKTFRATVVDSLPLTNIAIINRPTTLPVNTTITMSGRTVGGTKPVSYQFFFKRTANTKWNKLSYGNEKRTYAKFTPTAAASYDLRCVAIDSEGTIAEKTYTITATK